MAKVIKKRLQVKSSAREVQGLGYLPMEARHGFLLSVPKGNGKNDFVRIVEFRNAELSTLEKAFETISDDRSGNLRVKIDRNRWLELAPGFWDEANQRLRANGLPSSKFQKNPSKAIPIHPSLGKELCILCWAVEEAQPEQIPNALLNWQALAPEERWWLYTMAVATTGQAVAHRGQGWRKALRAALAENFYIKGDGLSPRSRRELLGHSQLAMDFD